MQLRIQSAVATTVCAAHSKTRTPLSHAFTIQRQRNLQLFRRSNSRNIPCCALDGRLYRVKFAGRDVMVQGGSKGSSKAAAELVRMEPQHMCSSWTRPDQAAPEEKLCLETQIQLRARRHAVEFQGDILNFPRYYKVTPSSGVIPANSSVTLTVRQRFTEKTRRTKFQHARGSALWTDLRVHVKRYCEDESVGTPTADLCERRSAVWAQDKSLDTDFLQGLQCNHHTARPRIKRTKDRRRKDPDCFTSAKPGKRDHMRVQQSTTFVKTLKLRPLALSQASDCSICIGEMNVQRHAAGIEDEMLFAFGCGHVFHTNCIVQMTEVMACPCGCMSASCPLCRRPISPVESALLVRS